MHQRIIVPILALSILALVAATAPADKEAFDGAMETASSQLRTMRRTKFDPKSQQQNLEALQKLESALLTAKANIDAIEMSPQAKAKYGSDVLAYRMAFRTELIKSMQASLELELAVLKSDVDAAAAAYKKLGGIRNDAHDVFEAEE